MFTSVLIGDESLLIRCGDILLGRGHLVLTVITDNADIAAWAKGQGIDAHPHGSGVDAALPDAFDYLFSIANLRLIPDAVIARARQAAINFHDGPLPRYAGLNAPVWALLNGETHHGVAWHRIEGGVDEGRLCATALVQIGEDETALTLNAKCYAAAVDSFTEMLGGLETGAQEPEPQDLSQRSYFGKAKRPDGGGFLDFRKSRAALLRQVRALDHGPYWNPVGCAKLLADQPYIIAQAAPAEGSGAPGTVLSVGDGAVTVMAADGALHMSQLRTHEGGAADISALVVGETVPPLDMPALTEAAETAAKAEAHWRAALSDAKPLMLRFRETDGGSDSVTLPLTGDRLIALIAAVALRSAGETAGDLALAIALNPSPAMLADWVPLRATGATFDALFGAVEKALATARKHPHLARDLAARDPAIGAPQTPDIGISTHGAPIPGVALTCVVTDTGVTLHGLDTQARAIIAERLETLACAVADGAQTPLAGLPLTGPQERARIEAWNATDAPFEADRPMHGFVEAASDRGAEKTAIIYEDQALTHAGLEAQANRIAHTLRARGIADGAPVGLYCRRGFGMVAGALGILKAGGAYVPMDPTYPADRIAHFLSDSGAHVVVTEAEVADTLPTSSAQALVIDRDDAVAQAPAMRGDWPAPGGQAMAYMIYTSGSTGQPKGVMVSHANVANFFAGMDAHVTQAEGSTWLAVTSLSFDIAVLEVFYALARGFRVVIGGDPDRMRVAEGPLALSDSGMDFSLFYWGNDDGPGPTKYKLLLEGAKFADQNGFRAVWTPERHFHAFGGPYPNPAVTGAAVAAVTSNLDVRAGSCVAPLHHPARIAEEWAVIDNLTGGRAGIGFASGWQPDDFILRPENTPPANKPATLEALDQVRQLWRGDAVDFPKADGGTHAVVTQPRPVSRELPVWLTTAGNPETWRDAGRAGANVLTHLLGQSIDEVGGKIKLYRAALREAGHDPAAFTVTLMLHTFVAESREEARRIARDPMKDYLRSAAGLIKQYAWAFPAFKKPAGTATPMDIDLGSLSEDEMEGILDFAFERYFEESGLFGTVADCAARVEALKAIGVGEVACLIDYGIAPDMVLEGLRPLAEVVQRANAPAAAPEGDYSIAAQILRHQVTHLQCTPSMARMICLSETAKAALTRLDQVLLGGEALSGALVAELQSATSAQILNMYGPTETTIWSSVGPVDAGADVMPLGHPIANTALHVLGADGAPVPLGVPGELVIGGAGVTLGYWQRDDLTAARFAPGPGGARVYRTGDLVCQRADGRFDFLGRLDHQIKLRGHRIELGEIEARLAEVPGVTGAVVIAREDRPGDVRLVAYVTGAAPAEGIWRGALGAALPEYMMPSALVGLASFPLTPNAKIDRNALPAPMEAVEMPPQAPAVNGLAGDIIAVFQRLLGVPRVAASDNFFALGGHSLLAVQAHRDLSETLGQGRLAITDIFRFPTPEGLARHLGKASAPPPEPQAPRETQVEARRALRRRRTSGVS